MPLFFEAGTRLARFTIMCMVSHAMLAARATLLPHHLSMLHTLHKFPASRSADLVHPTHQLTATPKLVDSQVDRVHVVLLLLCVLLIFGEM
jgi:hypothetical protein